MTEDTWKVVILQIQIDNTKYAIQQTVCKVAQITPPSSAARLK